MLQRLQPPIVGHYDLIRLFRPDFPLTEAIWERVKRNIQFVVGYGGLFEVNTRALKKNLPSPYPLLDIVKVHTIDKKTHTNARDNFMYYYIVHLHIKKFDHSVRMSLFRSLSKWTVD
jgi:HisJ family histidinol phosphate phosphatase